MKVYSHEKRHSVKLFLVARKVIQVEEMIEEEEEEESKNKRLQTARVSGFRFRAVGWQTETQSLQNVVLPSQTPQFSTEDPT